MCGPTASGKSDLADSLAEKLAGPGCGRMPTIVVDSMQVYRELPVITNQARRLPAELVAVVSVIEQWTVARHREAAKKVVDNQSGRHFVLDAGTGMYLNALLLNVPLAPKVAPALRRRAQEEVSNGEADGDINPRRAARAKELELAGERDRGSIWDGSLLYDATIFYRRPARSALDAAIAERSAKIMRKGLREAELIRDMLAAGAPVNPSVTNSVGLRELTQHLSGNLLHSEAENRINVRTRQLARRQIRWFDKLVRTLQGIAEIHVLSEPPGQEVLHGMHDIIRS